MVRFSISNVIDLWPKGKKKMVVDDHLIDLWIHCLFVHFTNCSLFSSQSSGYEVYILEASYKDPAVSIIYVCCHNCNLIILFVGRKPTLDIKWERVFFFSF